MIKIDSVGFGEITIDGKIYYSDMIIWWDGKKEYREKIHEFTLDDFMALTHGKPTSIIIGTGENEMFKIEEEAKTMAKKMKILLYIETSKKAIEIFNAFVAEGEKPIAVIHTG